VSSSPCESDNPFPYSDPTVFDECDIDETVKDKLLDEIRKKLAPKALRIRSDIEVSCFAYDGIEAVKKALLAGKQCSTEEMPIKVWCFGRTDQKGSRPIADQPDCCSPVRSQ
jgi:tRNA A37 threonylcarbamoyladenosine dehydratase